MRSLRAFAVLLALAPAAAAQMLSLRGLIGYESHDVGSMSIAGLRQTYDLRLEKALTTTSLLRLYVRGDDYQGTTGSSVGTVAAQRSSTRQLQPFGEFLVNVANVHAAVREEMFDIQSRTNDFQSKRTIDRTSGYLSWDPERLPHFESMGQRNHTRDEAGGIDLTEDSAYARATYEAGGLSAYAGERYVQSTDTLVGYERRTTTHEANVAYARTAFGGKLALTANTSGQFSNIDEQALDGKGTSVPAPVAPTRALYGVDDTPADDRDRPLASYPTLLDGNINSSAGISLGPDGVSFQNFALDLGGIQRLDEIRIVVRDAQGAPLRLGGGPITWDVYTSADGVLWAPLPDATSSFNNPLSLYSIVFPQTSSRWFKVVNFGVGSEPALVTEIQAYYHTLIAPGGQRAGTQQLYAGLATVSWQPVPRFLVTYTSLYNALRQQLQALPRTTSTDFEHLGSVEYHVRTWLAVRSELQRRDVTTSGAISGGGGDGASFFVDVTPTRDLRSTLEISRQTETVGDTAFVLTTRALHTTAYVYRTLSANLDLGTQTQTLSGGGVARRDFVTLTSNAQLTSRLRMLLSASSQRGTTTSSDPAAQLLGPEKDNRLASQWTWRPGPQLALTTIVTWVSSSALSGLSERYHVEWYPFGDGTLSLGASIDEDIDPVQNRRARRVIVNPRWLMNRWATIDLNYTSVNTALASNNNRQRSAFATLTLTK
jgi:hypothetical protein